MALSPYRLKKARETYNSFNIFNAVSWNLLVGIIITLFALRLEASSSYIGLMSSAYYVALFLLPLGKLLARRFSIIGIYSFTWTTRSLCMLFAVAAPFFEYAGHRNTALLLIMLGVWCFHLFRGVGMIGNNPVLSQLATGSDKGSYMTQIQIINSAIGMFGSFIIAMVLGMNPPIFIFSILLIIGVVTGAVSGTIIKKVPEPEIENNSSKAKLIDIFKDAFTQDNLKQFMFILFLVVLVSGVTRTFVVVYAREVFAHNDGLISLYSVFGGLGYLMAGLSVKFLVDRLGAKPLFLVSVIIGAACLVPIVCFPSSFTNNVTGAILFMVFLFFMMNFGFLGSEGIAQTYFLALIPQDKVLDMGILYFFIFGAAGALGSLLSGFLLDALTFFGLSYFISFKVLFAILIALVIVALSRQKHMRSLGSLPLRDALEVIFSFKDLRAISILDKLNKAEDSVEEEELIGALHVTPSYLATDGLLERARSPRFVTRVESIRALEKLDKLNDKAIHALIDDVKNNQYTTAYISARILGNHNYKDAIPLLRDTAMHQLAESGDYMLAGEAIIALAKMKDEEFRPETEKITLETQNPRLKIMGAEALGYYKNTQSIPVLLDILRRENPRYLNNEVVLAISAVLDIDRFFYKMLVRYNADNSLIKDLAMDEVESAVEFVKSSLSGKRKSLKDKIEKINALADRLHYAVSCYFNEKNPVELSGWILDLKTEGEDAAAFTAIKNILGEAVIDVELCKQEPLFLLIVQWAARKLRILTKTVK